MTVVRELITLLGFSVDKASYAKAERAYDQLYGKVSTGAAQATGKAAQQAAKGTNQLAQALGMLQRVAAAAGLSHMVKDMVGLASDANEVKSALGQVFGEQGGEGVSAWAATMSQELGRSKYALESFASRLGAVAQPMLGNRQRAQEMSQAFAALAVDMGSFYNTSDEDALLALRSAMTGEAESIKRYGVVMNDATMQQYAFQQGIKKKITAMTIAEKTELRYGFIMQATANAQGDAKRTGDGYANSTKRLQDAMRDLKTDMGKTVIPTVEKLVHMASAGVTAFNEMAANSNILRTAMWTLAGVAGVVAFEFVGAFILPAIGVAALILLIDDLWTTMEGGESVIRDIFGEGFAQSLQNIKREFDELGLVGMWENFAAGADNLGFAVQRLAEKFVNLLGWLNPIVAGFRLLKMAGQAMGIVGQDDAEGRAMGRGLDAPVAGSISEELALRQRDQAASIRAGVAARRERERYAKYGPSSYSVVPPAAAEPPMGYGVLQAPVPGAAGASGTEALTFNMAAPTIVINGGDEARVKRVVTETMEAERRKTMAAVGQRGRG